MPQTVARVYYKLFERLRDLVRRFEPVNPRLLRRTAAIAMLYLLRVLLRCNRARVEVVRERYLVACETVCGLIDFECMA